MNKFFIKKNPDLIYVLILSLPILAVISILLLELTLLIISTSFLINSFKKKNFYYFNNLFFKFFSIFYIYILINFLIQTDSIDTLSIIFYYRYIIYALAIYYFLDNKEGLFFDFLKVVSILIIFLGIDAIIQFTFKYNILGMEIIEKNRVSSFFGDELILGSFIFRLLPFVFLTIILDKKFFSKRFSYFLILLSFLIIFLSGERVSMILSLFLLIIYFILLKENNVIKNLRVIFIGFIIIVSTILTFSKDYQYRYVLQPFKDLSNSYNVTQDLLKNYDKEPRIIFFSGLHHNLMITSLRIFNENKIFGSGPRSYRNICKDYKINRYSCDTHPHNYYLQLLVETGVVGFSLLISLYIFVIKESFNILRKKKQKYKVKLCLIGFYISALWPIIPSGNIFNNWVSIMIFLPVPFYLYLSKNTK